MSKYKKYVTISDQSNKDYTVYEILNIIDDKDGHPYNQGGDKLATYSYIHEKLKDLTGKILTIIDASMPESKQSKCVKDLIRKEFMTIFRVTTEDLADVENNNYRANTAIENGALPQIVTDKEILNA
jgi:hypothetical protein